MFMSSLQAFKEFFAYDNVQIIPLYNYEKDIEILRDEIHNKIELSKEELIGLIEKFYNNIL